MSTTQRKDNDAAPVNVDMTIKSLVVESSAITSTTVRQDVGKAPENVTMVIHQSSKGMA